MFEGFFLRMCARESTSVEVNAGNRVSGLGFMNGYIFSGLRIASGRKCKTLLVSRAGFVVWGSRSWFGRFGVVEGSALRSAWFLVW